MNNSAIHSLKTQSGHILIRQQAFQLLTVIDRVLLCVRSETVRLIITRRLFFAIAGLVDAVGTRVVGVRLN